MPKITALAKGCRPSLLSTNIPVPGFAGSFLNRADKFAGTVDIKYPIRDLSANQSKRNYYSGKLTVHDNVIKEVPKLEVVIEVPRGSFLKRGSTGHLDFVSPLPCPFNYGSVEAYVGLDGDLLDAVVLGQRLRRGTRVTVQVLGAVGLMDRGMYDDKIICGNHPIGPYKRFFVLLFFKFYARCKGLLNLIRGRSGANRCHGWFEAGAAISRASSRKDVSWNGPVIPF